MNAEQLTGQGMQFKGDLQQPWGKFPDDDVQQIAGHYERFVGKVQERYGDKQSALMTWAAAWHKKPTPKPAGKENASP